MANKLATKTNSLVKDAAVSAMYDGAVYKSGNVVHICGLFLFSSGLSTNTWTQIATFSSEYSPSYTVRGVSCGMNASWDSPGAVATKGVEILIEKNDNQSIKVNPGTNSVGSFFLDITYILVD